MLSDDGSAPGLYLIEQVQGTDALSPESGVHPYPAHPRGRGTSSLSGGACPPPGAGVVVVSISAWIIASLIFPVIFVAVIEPTGVSDRQLTLPCGLSAASLHEQKGICLPT